MIVFFVRQETAYEMRISDWSSDVCSSDLGEGEDLAAEAELEAGEAALALGVEAAEVEPLRAARLQDLDGAPEQQVVRLAGAPLVAGPGGGVGGAGEIGRASGRDRGCQNGEVSVVAVSVKKKKIN